MFERSKAALKGAMQAHSHAPPTVHGELTISHGPDGAVTIVHQPHGEFGYDDGGHGLETIDSPDAVGNAYEKEDYGAGDAGTGYHPDLMSAGMDPFANADFGDEMDEIVEAVKPFFDPADDVEQAYLPEGAWEPETRVPVLRNPIVHFGDEVGFGGELYSGFGPAPIIGCESGFTGAGLKK